MNVIAGIVALPLPAASVARAGPQDAVERGVRHRVGQQHQRQHQLERDRHLNGQAVVVTKNSYDDVYGTACTSGRRRLPDRRHHRTQATFPLRSLDADLTEMGDMGTSRLYGRSDDYQSFGLDSAFNG